MAGVDGELTGAPGACVVTRGPGVASAVNGVAQALLDRQPMLLITDAVPLAERARISHQRLDQDALLAPVTKWSASIGVDGRRGGDRRGDPHRLRAAAGPGAPRLRARCAARRRSRSRRPSTRAATSPPRRALLAASERPVFALGVGARHAGAPLRRLLDGAPLAGARRRTRRRASSPSAARAPPGC